MSSLIGTRFNSVYYFWSKGGIYIYGLIFLFLSMLSSIFMFFYSIVISIKNKNNVLLNNLNRSLIEIFLFFIIFIPITILSFIIFKSKSGTFHYLYSAFSISFITYLIFFKFNEFNFKKI